MTACSHLVEPSKPQTKHLLIERKDSVSSHVYGRSYKRRQLDINVIAVRAFDPSQQTPERMSIGRARFSKDDLKSFGSAVFKIKFPKRFLQAC